ncbi:MAG: hypothetical protein JO190_09205 [Candidatus Eremiobacteraeota bacterium]|nr:hypothetical protein [Candidatus Eremiobacteraeota bacterium]MBV8497877.1 hypothetical protein [Candidatus Eremiobacteraeota bacterium]
MRCALPALTALAIFALPASTQAKIVSNLGVTIISCVVNSNGGNLTNGINVVYYNTHDSPATEVDFLLRYMGKRYILIDKGNFTRGAQINHNLTNALTGQPWDGPTPKLCRVERVYLANGRSF